LPNRNEIRGLLHALREPVGAFVIHLSLLDDEDLSEEARSHLEAMLVNVQRMVEALGDITSSFDLEAGSSTPLSVLIAQRQAIPR
jgi:hypothetical protein